ncbi:Uncharacterised protein [Serratia quinivorans]|uniref:hypothetical protein n=1 Tax=Serratia quinivorans TaxID=137545 RepID=UPI00217BC1E5|nr:hypothetical protein [Serratia quinivorans]CAI1616951.1 Uncharacterised protein [Serratia quinivorans]CAI2395282.1 Uncharacterised protein [Serratia quinivorans]
MGQAADTYARLIREQYADWQNRFYPKQKELMGLATSGQLMNDQLSRADANTQQTLNTAQVGQQNQMARYGVAQSPTGGDNSLGLRSALATAGAKNGIREGEADRQMNILTGGSASLRQQMNIGGGSSS